MNDPLRSTAALLLCLALAACDRSPTEPDLLDENLNTALGPDGRAGGGPGGAGLTLQRLTRQSIGQVRQEQGEAAAKALTAELRQLIEQGRTIREAGDVTAMRAHMDAVRLASAGIVIEVRGAGVAETALAKAEEILARRIAMIEARQAAGQTAPLVNRVVERAKSLRDEAVAAAGSGEAARALDLATRMIDILEHRTQGPGTGGMLQGGGGTRPGS